MALILNKRIQTDKTVSPPILSFVSIVQDTTIDYDGSATLNSTAQAINPSTSTAAVGSINYQWYKNGNAISGANSATLTLTNQILAANYYCVASFVRSGSTSPAINSPITSRTATTTIRNNIVISRQPENKSVVSNKSAVFVCSAYPNPKSMSGFNPVLYGGIGFGLLDYNAAISQGFSDSDIRYYLEQVFTDRIGPEMISKLNDSNFGTDKSRNLVYEWYVNGNIAATTRGNSTSQISGFNGNGIYLDLTQFVGRTLVEFNVTEDSQNYHRIYIPDLSTINDGVNAQFLRDGYIAETLPNSTTAFGSHRLLLDGGRIYGPISSNTLGPGFLAVASEINQGSNDRIVLNDNGQGPVSNVDDMVITINKGFFKTYFSPSGETTVNGVTFAVNAPPRVKSFSTLTVTDSTIQSSSVFCKVRLTNVSGDLAPPPINSNTVTWTISNSQCLNWDNSERRGGQIFVTTQAGLKPSNEDRWYGVWEWGTNNDTCYINFDVEIKDIHPRAGFTDANLPFAVEFECNISAPGKGDVYQIYKVVDWGGSSPNQNAGDRKNLGFNDSNVNGETNIYYGDNDRILFQRTNTSKTAWGPDAGGGRLYWDPSWGKARMYIRVGRALRKSNGNQVNWFAQVDTTKTDNRLEYGRRFDQFEDVY